MRICFPSVPYCTCEDKTIEELLGLVTDQVELQIDLQKKNKRRNKSKGYKRIK